MDVLHPHTSEPGVSINTNVADGGWRQAGAGADSLIKLMQT